MKRTICYSFLIVFVAFSSCKKNDSPINTSQKNISYPAAYIVNGQSNTLSVIRLSNNTLSDSIDLMGSGSTMIMWPHHIYNHENHMSIGVPGMDLSAGHSGGMAGMKGRLVIMDATKGTMVQNIELPLMNHNAIYSPNGSEVWTTQMDNMGKLFIYDAVTFALKSTINVGDDPAEVTFSADGTKAYVCNGGNNTVTVINPADKTIITTLNVGVNPVGAWPSSIGKMFVDNETSGSISIINVAGNNVAGTIYLGFTPGYAAYHTGSNELWVTNPVEGKVAYYQDMGGNTWMKHGEIATGDGAHAVAFYGNTAYVTNQIANTVSVINVASHATIKTINVGKKPNGIAFKL